jgi:hypothetical protein
MKPASTRTQRFWLDLTHSLHSLFTQVTFTAQACRCWQRESSGVERRVAGQTLQLLSEVAPRCIGASLVPNPSTIWSNVKWFKNCSSLTAWPWRWRHYEPFKPLNVQLNPICHLLALLGAHNILHISKIRVTQQEVSVQWWHVTSKKTSICSNDVTVKHEKSIETACSFIPDTLISTVFNLVKLISMTAHYAHHQQSSTRLTILPPTHHVQYDNRCVRINIKEAYQVKTNHCDSSKVT